jgi:hypothetical protein
MGTAIAALADRDEKISSAGRKFTFPPGGGDWRVAGPGPAEITLPLLPANYGDNP